MDSGNDFDWTLPTTAHLVGAGGREADYPGYRPIGLPAGFWGVEANTIVEDAVLEFPEGNGPGGYLYAVRIRSFAWSLTLPSTPPLAVSAMSIPRIRLAAGTYMGAP